MSCKIELIIAPKSSRNAVLGEYQGRIKIALTAAPADGKANQALIEFLAEKLKLPKRSISILHGLTSKRKLVEINGIDDVQVRKLLA